VVGPLPPPIGGVETFTQALLESGSLDRFEVAHCDTTKGRPKSTQGRFDAGNAVWALRHFGRLAAALRRHRPDAVYVPIAGTFSGVLRDLALGWIARRSGAVVVGHQHDGDIMAVLARRGLAARVVHRGFDQFHRLLVLGEPWRRMLAAYGVAAPLEIVPSMCRREVYERGAAHARPIRAGGPVRALFVGQVGRRKGVPELLEAARHAIDGGADLTLWIVGPAEEPGAIESAAGRRDALGLGNRVELTGPLMGGDLYARFGDADLFVLPSHIEGIPVVLYEAGAFGLPVLTTPVGAITDVVRDGENGLLVPPGDIAALAGALSRLCADPPLRARLGEAMRRTVGAFHPDRVASRVADAIQTTLAERGRRLADAAREGRGTPA
jgi:glycosyltransferase involved in cell wall biosynthesis